MAALERTRERIKHFAETGPSTVVEDSFRTLVLNRAQRCGIVAPRASLANIGENGKGILSRWYPDTLNS